MADGGRVVEPTDEQGAGSRPVGPDGKINDKVSRDVQDAAALDASQNGAVDRDPLDTERPQAPESTLSPGSRAIPQGGAQTAYSLIEVAKHLQVSPDTLRSWNRRFAQLLNIDQHAETPRYSSADVAVLLTVQKLIDQRLSDEQVVKQLMPRRIEPERSAAALAVQRAGEAGEGGISSAAQALTDVLSVIAGSQQSVLNSQSSMREMVTVVVQDNFNLKDENRKLRDRMLELERALAEYQRREETRKERMEARMRALEGTVAALQQQMAQFVQLQRAQARKRGFW